MSEPTDRESMIQHLVETTNLLREEAEEIVAIHLGESFGDIEPIPPLTREERRRIGLGLTWEEAAELRRRRALAPEPAEPPVVTNLSPEERAEVIAHLLATTNIPPELVDEELDIYFHGGERASRRPVLPNERRLIGRRIEQVLERRRTSGEIAAGSGRA